MHELVEKMAEVFKALGDPTRLKIIRHLASKMEPEINVSDFSKKFGVSQPAISQHMKVLKNVKILRARREGIQVFYYIDTNTLSEYKEEIDELFQMAFEKCPNEDSCLDSDNKKGEKSNNVVQ